MRLAVSVDPVRSSQRRTVSSPHARRRRSSARSSASSSAADSRTPSSRWNALTTSVPSPRSDFRSARPTIRSRQRKRQHVVAVPPLVLLLVDLDQVVEAEHATGERPVPEEVVEGREEHRRRRPRRIERGSGRDDDGRAAILDRDSLEDAVRDEGVEHGTDPGDAAAQPPVLDDARLGQRAARGDRLGARVRATARARPARARRAPPSESPARAGRRDAGTPAGPRSRDRRGSRADRASPSPASSSTSRPLARLRPRSAASRAARAPGSRPGSPRQGGGASRRRRRTTCARRCFICETKSGHSSTGSRQASWAQYSKTRPLPRSRGTARAGYAPTRQDERDPVAALDGRDRVELDAREPPDRASTSRDVPAREREEYPWAAIASRRSATRERVRMTHSSRGGQAKGRWPEARRMAPPAVSRERLLAVATWTSRCRDTRQRRVARPSTTAVETGTLAESR